MLNKLNLGLLFRKKTYSTRIIILFSFLAGLLTACQTQPVQQTSAPPAPEIIATAYTSFIIGELINDDGCIRILDHLTHKSSTLIWPPDTSAAIEGNQVRIITGLVTKEVREVVLNFGDIVKISGGESAFPDEELLDKLPPSCEKPYWIVGFSVTSFQLVEEP